MVGLISCSATLPEKVYLPGEVIKVDVFQYKALPAECFDPINLYVPYYDMKGKELAKVVRSNREISAVHNQTLNECRMTQRNNIKETNDRNGVSVSGGADN